MDPKFAKMLSPQLSGGQWSWGSWCFPRWALYFLCSTTLKGLGDSMVSHLMKYLEIIGDKWELILRDREKANKTMRSRWEGSPGSEMLLVALEEWNLLVHSVTQHLNSLAGVLIATNVNLNLSRSRLNQLIWDARLACPFELCSYYSHLIILWVLIILWGKCWLQNYNI